MNWKHWTGLGVALVLIGFAVARLQSSFRDRPPAWLRQQDKRGPGLPAESRKHFQQFRREIELEAEQKSLPVASIQFIELMKDGKEGVVWNTEKVTNQGFKPLADFEMQGGGDEERLRGYYTLEGEPLGFTVKHHPNRPKSFYMAVHLRQPLPPGQSVLVLRLERRAYTIKPNAKGEAQLGLGRLTRATTAVHARGLCLPDRARLVQYRPDKGAFAFEDNPPMVGWINSCLDPAFPPLNATFILPK